MSSREADMPNSGFRAFYSRPPLFLVVTASTQEQLAAKVAALDAKLSAQDHGKTGETA